MAETMIPMPGMEVEISVQGMQASRFEAIEAAEAARSTAETERENAESARASAEQARVNAESARNAAESGRKAAEETREQNEAARAEEDGRRATAEAARAEAENLRALAETGRAASEAARAAAESARASAEQVRADAEAGREAAEAARQETFETNEVSRQETFEAAENDRATAEAAREVAEAARQAAFETNESNRQAAFGAAEAARASAETARAEAESVRVAAEKLRAETFAGYEGRLSAMDEAIASKADKTALALANRRLDALWKLNQGVSYQFETDDTEAYQKTVPSGAKLANIDSIGGHTEAVDGALVSAGVESVKYNDAVIADIPAAVRALPGYGWSAGSVHNGVERTETGWQYVQRVGRITFNGSEKWVDTSISGDNHKGFALKSTDIGATVNAAQPVCAEFPYSANEHVANTCRILKFSSTEYNVRFTVSTDFVPNKTTAEWKQYLAANPTVMYYPIDTEIYTDISDLMGDELDVIPVEAGGTLTFENAAQLAVPNSVEYVVALAEVK